MEEYSEVTLLDQSTAGRTAFLIHLSGGIAGFILLSLAAVFLLGWLRDPRAEIISIALHSDSRPIVGTPITGELIVRLPWFRRPLSAPSAAWEDRDMAVVDAGRPRLARLGPGYWDWQAKVVLQAYRPDRFRGKNIYLPVRPRRAGDENRLLITIPDVTINSVMPESGELDIVPAPRGLPPAEPVVRSGFSWSWLLTAVSAAAVAVIIVTRFTRGRGEPDGWQTPVNPRHKALREIAILQQSQPLDSDLLLVCLTDVVKAYCADSLGISTREKTSDEILLNVEQKRLLPRRQSRFLKRFFTCADQVKFARASIDREEIDNLLARVRRFITETGPAGG